MKPFSERFNKFILDWHLANGDKFDLYDTKQFDSENIEATYNFYVAHYELKGTIPMWDDQDNRNIFGSSLINSYFRGWHDLVHILNGFKFDFEGEVKSYQVQAKELPEDWYFERQLMFCEIVGQAAHYSAGGEPIRDQREFTKKHLQIDKLI